MNKAGKIVLWVIFGIGMVFLVAYVTQVLWNWLVPALFSGPAITFWQALGLLLLSKILFGGFGGKGCHKESHKQLWKNRISERVSQMSPEEREAFKQKMWAKWCPASEKEEDKEGSSNV